MEYGRYRILSQLGQGGMATVYLSEDPLLQRLVAIKVIQSHLSANSSLMDRFNTEAKTIASLRHLNIVEVFDFGVQDDQQFLVMEYIDGQNLQAICVAQSGRLMPNTVVAAIICQAAEGLTSAEKHGVVHRDIKPENLMFNSEGALKIADFGIAHIADEQSRTQTGAVLGSPNFMSPEQIEGLRPTNQTDIFSLGGVFYYCLTSKMPFTGPSIPVTMRNICERQQPAIIEINPDADPFLISLTDTMLQKLPENRGSGARWLANQLRSYLSSHQIVDIADHAKTYIASLGIAQGGNTIMEDPSAKSKRGSRISTGSSVSNFPKSAIIKTGQSTGSNKTLNKSLATGFDSNQQGTTGAMGPSSKSPVVWIGAFLSVCVLILAGVMVWSRLDKPEEARPMAKTVVAPVEKGVTPAPKVEPPPVTETPAATPATVSSMASSTNDRVTSLTPTAQTKSSALADYRHQTYTPPQRPNSHSAVKLPEQKDNRPESRSEPTPSTQSENTGGGQTGYVMVKSAPPFAALTINGKPQGETPMNAYLEVPLGKCHIEIVHRLSPPFDTVLNITPGYRREFKFKLDH